MSEGPRRFAIPPSPRTLVGIEPPSLRVVAEQAAIHSSLAERRADQAEAKVDDLAQETNACVKRIEKKQADQDKRLENIEHAYMAEIVPTYVIIKERLTDLDERLGRPPQRVDLSRISQVGNLTAEEITAREKELQQATGVFAYLGALELYDARAAYAHAVAAGKEAGETAAKQATKGMTKRTAGIVGTATAVLAALNASSAEWGPPLVKLFKFAWHLFVGG